MPRVLIQGVSATKDILYTHTRDQLHREKQVCVGWLNLGLPLNDIFFKTVTQIYSRRVVQLENF